MAGIAKEPSLRRNLILAYQIESILSDGRAIDITEIARWLNIGRTRLFQVANLLLLAPSIQEEIIFANNAIIEQIPEYKTQRSVKIHISCVGLSRTEKPHNYYKDQPWLDGRRAGGPYRRRAEEDSRPLPEGDRQDDAAYKRSPRPA